MRVLAFALLSGGLTLLSACGGGHADAPPLASNGVPASALVSATAFTEFVGSLAADNGAEPLDVEGIVPPVSDTDGPGEV